VGFLRGHASIFNARYSPELNPIESAFSKVKYSFKKLMEAFPEKLILDISKSFTTITSENIKGFMDLHIRNLRAAIQKSVF
jgi:transposase